MRTLTEITNKFDGNYFIFLAQDVESKEFFREAMCKVEQGIKYKTGWSKTASIESIKTELDYVENISPRPYRIWQSCDGTIGSCVIALFFKFCNDHKYSANELLAQAYEEEDPYTLEAMDEVIKLAEWEGLEYPKFWDEFAKAGLIESLTEINFHNLAGVLAELPEFEGFNWSTGRFSDVELTLFEKAIEILRLTTKGNQLLPRDITLVAQIIYHKPDYLPEKELNKFNELHRVIQRNLYSNFCKEREKKDAEIQATC